MTQWRGVVGQDTIPENTSITIKKNKSPLSRNIFAYSGLLSKSFMQKTPLLEDLLNTPQKKLSFFQNLVLVAAADKFLGTDESNLLLTIGNKLGLSSEQVMPMADNLAALSFIIPEDGMQRTLELQTLVQMMMQDGDVHDREYTLCLEYANRIGYSKDILDDMVRDFSTHNSGAE